MQRFAVLALALVACTGENEAAPDERCHAMLPSDMPDGAVLVLETDRGFARKYILSDGATLKIWPGTRTPQEYYLYDGDDRVDMWGCWPGGELAFECGPGDGYCTCYESGQSWECPAGSNGWFSAVADADDANGPYVNVTQ